MQSPILVCAGTRPEAIKLAPVVLRLRDSALADRTLLCVSGQHVALTTEALEEFGLDADMVLAPPAAGLDLLHTMTGLTERLFDVIRQTSPGMVVALGDTATAFAAALAAGHAAVPLAHVEAGLRTGDLSAPFPEEMYRKMISVVASHHYAPTPAAARNLQAEGIPPELIHVTGNTGIDALHLALRGSGITIPTRGRPLGRVLVSLHRRETLGPPFEVIFEAIRHLAEEHPGVRFVCPLHPNPILVDTATRVLRDGAPPNLDIIAPLRYREFIKLLAESDFLLTDSGGLQEEAPVLGVPVLVLRRQTDRAEAVDVGNALVVGLEPTAIRDAANALLAGGEFYDRRTGVTSPFGDGQAASRIVAHLCQVLEADGVPAHSSD